MLSPARLFHGGDMKKKILFEKYLIYTLLLLVSYVLQTTPGLLVILGNKPMLVLGAVVCIAFKEGELRGGVFGAVGGMLCDTSAFTYYGFYTMTFLVIGTAVGLLAMVLVRDRMLNAAMLTLAGVFLVKLMEYFFVYGMWGWDSGGLIFLTKTLPTVVYSVVFTPLWYWMFSRLSAYYAKRLEVR